MRILLLLLAFFGFSNGSIVLDKDENHLPAYLQGIGWQKVEDVLKRDLRLNPSVRPIHYDLNLDVSVAGYGNEQSSTFNGTVTISLNITEPVREIELHSLGLDITKVDLIINENVKSEYLNGGQFRIRDERETIAIPSIRLILPMENPIVKITYNGTARMDGVGFYESWNRRENSTDLPYISLVTDSETNGARRWFPCFDEPDKKATFRLSVTHPIETSAYSNTRIVSTTTNNRTRVTHFNTTVPLPTYVVALAVTEQPVVELTANGYEFRAIGKNRHIGAKVAAEALAKLHNHSIFDNVPFIPEKTDILEIEDYSMGAMENPGLITFSLSGVLHEIIHIHELAHMYFGNLVTLSTWGDIWLNEGFATLYETDSIPDSAILSEGDHLFISLHDIPIHSEHTFTSSIHLDNFFHDQGRIHYGRASQFLRMMRKFVGGSVFDSAVKKYLLDNAYGNGDATKMISYLLDEYDGNRSQLHKILHEWIYQPGVAILFAERNEDGVSIHQKRLHSTYFNKNLRDESTRFTIPLFYKIDGESHTTVFDSDADSLNISLNSKSSFKIDNSYGNLFGVWLAPELLPRNRRSILSWVKLSEYLYRLGYIGKGEFITAVSTVAGKIYVRSMLQNIIEEFEETPEEDDVWADRETQCGQKGIEVDAPLSKLFMDYLKEFDESTLICSAEGKDREKMKELLYHKIVTDELKIRSDQLGDLITSIEEVHPGVSMEFVMKELEKNPSSLPLRLKLREIIDAVYYGKESDCDDPSMLHELIRKYPSVAAENYDVTVMTLEKMYVEKAMRERESEFTATIKEILKGAVSSPVNAA